MSLKKKSTSITLSVSRFLFATLLQAWTSFHKTKHNNIEKKILPSSKFFSCYRKDTELLYHSFLLQLALSELCEMVEIVVCMYVCMYLLRTLKRMLL